MSERVRAERVLDRSRSLGTAGLGAWMMESSTGRFSRDARPFLAHHLRRHADGGDAADPKGLHLMARWVENLPAGDPRLGTIEATDALGYVDGSFDGGPEAEDMITTCEVGGDIVAREAWLRRFADAVRRYWA